MKPNTIDDYIKAFPQDVQTILHKVRALVRDAAPDAEEGFSYGVPAFKLQGKNLILFAGFKNHLGIYPEPKTIKVFQNKLSNYKTSEGTIQFQYSEPIPFDLLQEIVKFRVDEMKRK